MPWKGFGACGRAWVLEGSCWPSHEGLPQGCKWLHTAIMGFAGCPDPPTALNSGMLLKSCRDSACYDFEEHSLPGEVRSC